ncbi:Dabb family protein [bacterium]|nr:Dabb family protein [bacterium]
MIRHIVLIRFQRQVTEAEIATMFQALPKLAAKLGVLGFACGRSESPEQIERGYKHGFTIDFASWEALQAYADDPDHKEFGGQLVAHAEGGIDGILVFDLAVG